MQSPDRPKDEFDQFLEEYGVVRPPRYLSEAAAPPVDEGRLRALAHGELDPDEGHDVFALIAMFRSWDEGYRRILDAGPALDRLSDVVGKPHA